MRANPAYVSAVCLGNICRSPMAEAVLRSTFVTAGYVIVHPRAQAPALVEKQVANLVAAGEHVVVLDSCGTSGWHVGEPADPRALATLRAAGYSLTHQAAALDVGALHPGQWLLVMDQSNLHDVQAIAPKTVQVRLLRSFDDSAAPMAEVPDPYYGTTDGFQQVLNMVERAAKGFVSQLDQQTSQG